MVARRRADPQPWPAANGVAGAECGLGRAPQRAISDRACDLGRTLRGVRRRSRSFAACAEPRSRRRRRARRAPRHRVRRLDFAARPPLAASRASATRRRSRPRARQSARSSHEHGVQAQRVPLGVDLQRWPLRHRCAAAGRAARLVHVASLNRVKDQGTLLRALRILADGGRDFHLDVVGEDTLARRDSSIGCRARHRAAHPISRLLDSARAAARRRGRTCGGDQLAS